MTRMIDPEKLAHEIEFHKLWSGMSTGKRIQWEAAFEAAKVEVEPVIHGYWIYSRYSVECSRCGNNFSDACDLENCDNFCRHCGAKMDAERPGCGEDACTI